MGSALAQRMCVFCSELYCGLRRSLSIELMLVALRRVSLRSSAAGLFIILALLLLLVRYRGRPTESVEYRAAMAKDVVGALKSLPALKQRKAAAILGALAADAAGKALSYLGVRLMAVTRVWCGQPCPFTGYTTKAKCRSSPKMAKWLSTPPLTTLSTAATLGTAVPTETPLLFPYNPSMRRKVSQRLCMALVPYGFLA